jgi:hypothetical protein
MLFRSNSISGNVLQRGSKTGELKFHIEDPQILDTNPLTLVAQSNWHLEFVCPCSNSG